MSCSFEYKQPNLLHHHHHQNYHYTRHKLNRDRELRLQSNTNLYEHFKEKLNSIKKQNKLNEQLLSQTKNLLNGLLSESNCKEKLNRSKLCDKHSFMPLISRVNIDLIKYVKLKENYMQHNNYWHQMWLFTDNPLCEYGNAIAD
jgi:hypothetical protein